MTTLHCINSAIVKLGRLSKPTTVYRGLSGSVLPPQFWKGTGNGGVEFAFMSTTSDREVAMGYARGRREARVCGRRGSSLAPWRQRAPDPRRVPPAQAATVMEIQMGMIDRGADLSWCSQCELPARPPAARPRHALPAAAAAWRLRASIHPPRASAPPAV